MSESFQHVSAAMILRAGIVPWDTTVFGYPVVQISELCLPNTIAEDVSEAKACFVSWLDRKGVRLVSCRLAHDAFTAADWLEDLGFRFIEMVLHPRLERLSSRVGANTGLVVMPPDLDDLEHIAAAAERCFGYERYHCDPNVENVLADRRYGNWVRQAGTSDSQLLLKIVEGSTIVGFFVIERTEPGEIYWHLTAITPEFQGRGYGKRAWETIIAWHAGNGDSAVTTTISARNTPVLNLYASLNFRFLPPEITFHWHRN